MSKFKHNNESMTIFYFQVLNLPENAGRFNISTQFPHYREIFYKPDFRNVSRGKAVIFDVDMSPGDFVSLIYLLKEPREVIDLKVRKMYVTNCTNLKLTMRFTFVA